MQGGGISEQVTSSPWEKSSSFLKTYLERKTRIQEKGKGEVCGNNICEPGLGETKENCPKDCSAQ